jgi:hypothetical protein
MIRDGWQRKRFPVNWFAYTGVETIYKPLLRPLTFLHHDSLLRALRDPRIITAEFVHRSVSVRNFPAFEPGITKIASRSVDPLPFVIAVEATQIHLILPTSYPALLLELRSFLGFHVIRHRTDLATLYFYVLIALC